jgi:biotin transport system substrate-specific component
MHRKTQLRDWILAALFVVLMAISARLTLPLPLVPITLQFTVCALAGLLLGPALGALSMAVYLFMGLVGLPVFATGGGIGYALSPTIGYLAGFIAAAAITGWLSHIFRRSDKPAFWALLLAVLAGLAVDYALGVAGLWAVLNLVKGKATALPAVLALGTLPYLVGDLLKSVIAATLGMILLPAKERVWSNRG